MSSLRDDTRRLEREILEILARASGSDDGISGVLARTFALLCANGNAGIASLAGRGEGVAVLAAYPVPPAFDDEAWPAERRAGDPPHRRVHGGLTTPLRAARRRCRALPTGFANRCRSAMS